MNLIYQNRNPVVISALLSSYKAPSALEHSRFVSFDSPLSSPELINANAVFSTSSYYSIVAHTNTKLPEMTTHQRYGFPSVANNFIGFISGVNHNHNHWTSRLSPELLGYIFYLASAGSNEDSLRSLGVLALGISQVNRHWRRVALACKHVWQGPVLDWSLHSSSFEFIKAIIRRSSPLLLDLVIPNEMAPELYPEVMQEIRMQDRTRTLHVHISPELVTAVMRQTRYRPMARLPTRRNSVQNVSTPPRQPLVPMNPQSIMPQQSMAISRNFFPSLRLLHHDQQCLAPVAMLMDCVRDSMTLEILRINGQHEDELSSNIDDESTVDLPETLYLTRPCVLNNLKELSIAASMPSCASLVKNIAMKPNCSILLTCYNANNARLTQYLDILRRMDLSMKPWRCEQEVESCGRQTLYVSATHIGFSLEGPNPDSLPEFLSLKPEIHPHLSLVLDWRQSSTPLDDLATLLPRMLTIFAPRRQWPTTFSVDADTRIPIARVVRGPIVEWLVDHDNFQALEFRTFDALVLLEPLFRLRNHRRAITNCVMSCLAELTFYEIVYTPSLFKTWRRLIRGLHRRKKVARINCTQVDFINCAVPAKEMNTFGTLMELVQTLIPVVDEVLMDGEDLDYEDIRVDDDMGWDTDSTVHQDSDIEL